MKLILFLSFLYFITFQKVQTSNLYSESFLPVHSTCQSRVFLHCHSSCSLASSCWGEFQSKDSYIFCSWNASENMLQSISISDDLNQCFPDVTCPIDSPCYLYVYYNNSECSFFLSESLMLRIILKEAESLCSISSQFNPCFLVKLDPPIIESIQVKKRLEVGAGKPLCLQRSWGSVKYQLVYSIFNGDFYFAKEIKEESSNPLFLIPLYEASQYNFSLKIVSNEVPDLLKVWSEPCKKNYLTGPVSAVDNNFISYQCASVGNTSTITASWKKSGIIDVFFCSLCNVVNGHMLNSSVSGSSMDNFFQTHFDELIFNPDTYFLSVIAKNSQGSSKITNSTVYCDSTGKKARNCHVSSNVIDKITIEWDLPSLSSSYDSFQIIANSSLGYYFSQRLPFSATQFSINGLHVCVYYQIEVFSVFGSNKVGSCLLHSYTVEKVPCLAPAIIQLNTSETFVFILLSNLLPNQSCGIVIYNSIVLKNASYLFYANGSNSFNISGLRPFTFYNLSVAAANNAGIGPFSKPLHIKTDEAAPSDPPNVLVKKWKEKYLISWTAPIDINGILSNYNLFIHHSKKNRNIANYPEDCNFTSYDTSCYIPAECRNITLNLMKGDHLSMNACTNNGKKCSVESSFVLVDSSDDFWYGIVCTTIIMCFCGVGCYLYAVRSTRLKIRGPLIHPDVIAEFSRFPQCGSSASCSSDDHEMYDSINEWRTSIPQNSQETISHSNLQTLSFGSEHDEEPTSLLLCTNNFLHAHHCNSTGCKTRISETACVVEKCGLHTFSNISNTCSDI